MSATLELPFLRRPPQKINRTFDSLSAGNMGVLFQFNDVTSLNEDEDNDPFDEQPTSLLIKAPKFIVFQPKEPPQDGESEYDDNRLWSTAVHPNIEYRYASLTYREQPFFEACLGDFTLPRFNFSDKQSLNILAGRVYQYITSYNHAGYASPLQVYADVKLKCSLCRSVKLKHQISLYNIDTISDLHRPDYFLPCEDCHKSMVIIKHKSRFFDAGQVTTISNLFSCYEDDFSRRHLTYSRKERVYYYTKKH